MGGVNVGHGPFLPLTSAVYFGPVSQRCDTYGNCYGGDYYLNISPSATDRELRTAVGTKSGVDAVKDPMLIRVVGAP